MHILIVTIIGLIVLALFVLVTRWMGSGAAAGARAFIPVWLIAALANGVYGMVSAGIPLINEIGALIPIFGIPTGVAWLVAKRADAVNG
jgi:hypothetical protein